MPVVLLMNKSVQILKDGRGVNARAVAEHSSQCPVSPLDPVLGYHCPDHSPGRIKDALASEMRKASFHTHNFLFFCIPGRWLEEILSYG